MRILLVNWNDRENPQAGGAEIHLHEIFGRLARAGHQIDLVVSGWAGASAQATVDGMRVHRVGDRNTFAMLGRGAVRRRLAANTYDIVVEDPAPVLCDRPAPLRHHRLLRGQLAGGRFGLGG